MYSISRINCLWIKLVLFCLLGFMAPSVAAHGVDDTTRQFLSGNQDVAFVPFIYIGAKHMVTGYDHLLFLVGVLFFLFKMRDVLIYVSCFTLGHSITLFYGVWGDIQVNPYLIDAIIGLSIVYKGFDNLGGFKLLFGFVPNTKLVVVIFGLFHGFGLASKLQEFELAKQGLFENLLAFNLGVELGQFFALTFVIILLSFWRRYQSYMQFSTVTNSALISAGLTLTIFQLTGFTLQ